MTSARCTNVIVTAAIATACACGTEGTRSPVCDQMGAVCELNGSEDEGAGDDDDRDPASRGTGGTSADSGTQGIDDDSTGGASTDDDGESDTGDGSGSDTGETGDTGEELTDPPPGFAPPQPFGDSVLETDLIGTWTLPTSGAADGYSMVLDVTGEGRFRWREFDDTCQTTQAGAGWIWVEGSQLVLLFGTWVGPAPWPVDAKYGWDAEAPFLVRAGYAPVLGHVAMTLPPAARQATPWTSRGYVRSVGGATANDVWITETELWAIAPEQSEADIVVRDRTTLDITSPGQAWTTQDRWWFQAGQIEAENPTVSHSGYVDDGVGTVALDGSAHVYVGASLATFSPGSNFVINGTPVCR